MDEITLFPSQKFPVARPEAQELLTVLTNTISDTHKIDLLYRRIPALEPLTLEWSISKLWSEALDRISLAGALTTFLQILADHQYEAVRGAANRLLTAPPPARRQILPNDIVVLDRHLLRDAVTHLENDESPCKVVLVRGSHRSGKSHGRYVFYQAARARGALRVYIRDGMVFTVEGVVELLFTAYGATEHIPPRGTTSAPAWYSTVCTRLSMVATKSGRELWIAVDGLGTDLEGAPLLDPDIVVFFNQFGAMLLNPAFSRWFRLMLIHYPDKRVPTQWSRELWVEDVTNETDICLEHVEAGIGEWCRAQQRDMHETKIRDIAEAVIGAADIDTENDQSGRLQRIHDALTDTLRGLASAPT